MSTLNSALSDALIALQGVVDKAKAGLAQAFAVRDESSARFIANPTEEGAADSQYRQLQLGQAQSRLAGAEDALHAVEALRAADVWRNERGVIDAELATLATRLRRASADRHAEREVVQGIRGRMTALRQRLEWLDQRDAEYALLRAEG
jgi:predicted component of type VI protein secretion system